MYDTLKAVTAGVVLCLSGGGKKRNCLGGRLWHCPTTTGVTYKVPWRLGGNLMMLWSFHRGKKWIALPGSAALQLPAFIGSCLYYIHPKL